MKPVNIGILGLGTVGSGAAKVLQDNAAEISRRLGRDVNVFMVSTRHADKAREVCPNALVTVDPFEVVKHPDVDIVVELFGGTDIAKDLVLEAVKNGKHVVTANKKLLAEYGNEIFTAAEAKNVMVHLKRQWRVVFRLLKPCAKVCLQTVFVLLRALSMAPVILFSLKCVKKAVRLLMY